MRKIREYDFNIYAPEDDVLTLSAYKLYYVGDGMYGTNHTDWTTIRFNKFRPEHDECIKFLLAYADEPEIYEDLDVWGFTTKELELRSPDLIHDWVKALPAYEVEEDADMIEQAKEIGKPYGEV